MQAFPEIRTLLFTITVIAVCRAVAMAYVWFIARQFRPIRFWAIGAALLAVGTLLVGLRDIVPPNVSIILGQSCVLAGWLLINGGIVIAAGRRVPWRTGILLVIASVAGVAWFHLAVESFVWRTNFVAAVAALFDGYAGLACFQASNKMRGTLRMLGSALCVLAISNVIKMAFIFHHDVQTLFLPDWQISQFYIIAIVVSVIGTILSVLLATQQVQERLSEELAAHRDAEANLHVALLRAEQFRLALDNVPSIVYIKDPQSRFTYANRPTLDFLKCRADDLIGSTGERAFKPEILRKILENEKAVLAGEALSQEFTLDAGTDDQRVYIELKTPVYEDSQRKRVIALCGIATDITEIKKHERLLEHVAHIDALTGLPNRLMLSEVLAKALAGSDRRRLQLGVAFIDLDGFKKVNDECGHDAGDTLLKTLAREMSMALRKGDTLARVGGDEFIAVLVDLDQQMDCDVVLQRLLAAASAPVTLNGKTVRVSASIGLAIYPTDGTEVEQLIRRADEAMYQAKHEGRNRFLRFSQFGDTTPR